MTTTLAWAAAQNAVEHALVFLVEGCEIAFTDYHTPATIKALWTATGHGAMSASWRSGLKLSGTIDSKIKLFDPKVEAGSLTVKCLDSDNYLIGLTQAEALATSARTVLRSTIDADDTSVPVQGVGGFDASGAAYVGHERFTYASTTGGVTPTFNTCVRGTLALFKTNGGTNFAASHVVATGGIYDGNQGVEVYSTPRVWLNRRCAVYLLHVEAGVFTDGAAPLVLWAGRIKSIADSDDGWIDFDVTNIAEQLDSLVFSSQYQAEIKPGAFFPNAGFISALVVSPSAPFTTVYGPVSSTPAGTWTHQEIADDVAEHLSLLDQTAGFFGEEWDIRLVRLDDADGLRYRIRMASTDSDFIPSLALSEIAWAMLGFDVGGDVLSTSGDRLVSKVLTWEGSSYYSLTAQGPPLLQYLHLKWGQRLFTANATGTWVNQLNIPIESRTRVGLTTNGYMMVDGRFTFAVDDLGDGSFDISQNDLGKLDAVADGVPVEGLSVRIPDDGANRTIKIKQLWVEFGDVATQMLRLALSTGTTGGYNHATYDDLTGIGFGVGIPASVLDINTWLSIQGTGYWLILDRPTKFSEILEHALEVRGSYLVWRRGKLAIVSPGEPSNGDGTYTLTEANKADVALTKYKRSSDAIINVCKLKLNRNVAGQYLDEVTVKAMASISDLGERKPVTIEAVGVYSGLLGPGGGIDEARETMAQALAYFSRPVCEITRSYSHALLGLAAGDTVNLTDDRVVDPTTGTRGVTLWPCWVSETKWDHDKGRGQCTLIFLPEFHKEQRTRWAPTAEVASSSVAGGMLTVTCTAHKYTPSTDTLTDSDYLDTAGMKLTLRSVSPTAGVGTSYVGLTVDSAPGANQIRFTTDPVPGALSTSLKWIVEFDDYSTVTASQQTAHAFIALETTRRILTVLSSFYRTWLPQVPYVEQAVDYTTLYRKRVDLADDDGEPHSVGWYIDAANAINTEYSAGTRQLLVAEMFDTDRTVASATRTFIAGPIFVPLYGFGRSLTVRARASCSGGGTASIRFVASIAQPSGTSATAFTFADSADTTVYAVASTASATQVFTPEVALADPSRMQEGRMHGMWLTVLASASAGTATVTSVEVYETVLT